MAAADFLAICPASVSRAGQQAAILNAFPVAAIVGDVFQQPIRRPEFRRGKISRLQPIDRRRWPWSAWPSRGDFWTFFALMLSIACSMCRRFPIVNSIAFANLKDPKDFGLIRMGGTIGWVLAAWPLLLHFCGLDRTALLKATRWTYIVAGIASLALAGFSLALPHTPPKKAETAEDKFAWVEAVRLLEQAVCAGAVGGDVCGCLCAQRLFQLGGACSWAVRKSASKATGSCPS